jgi:hypothetical protein
MNSHFGRCFVMSPGKPHRRWRKGFGVFAFNEAGRLFISPALIDMERTGWLCASHDGEEVLVTKKAVLVPLEWAARERPDVADDLLELRRVCESEAERLMESEGS